MNTRKEKVINFWYHTTEEGVMVQIKGLPIGKAQEKAIDILQEAGHSGATKKNVKKVEARHGNL